MPKNPRVSDAAAVLDLPEFGALLNGGTLRVYSGAQPTLLTTPLTDQVLLAECPFQAQAFGAPVVGATTQTISAHLDAEESALAPGTIGWCQGIASDGTVVCDGTASLASADYIFTDLEVVKGARVICTMTVTLPV